MSTTRTGVPADLDALLALYDGAVAWLSARGHAGQWGDQPWSAVQHERDKVAGWLAEGAMRVVERDGDLVAAVALSPEEGALWIRGLVARRGSGLGAELVELARAEAAERGLGRVRLVCWEGGGLVAYYARLGFVAGEPVGGPAWSGRAMELG